MRMTNARSVDGRAGRRRRRGPAFRSRRRIGRWQEEVVLQDGRTLWLRPLLPVDAPMLIRAFGVLSPEEVRLRFQHPLKEMSEDMARRLTHLDPEREFALAVAEPLPPGEALVGGVGRVAVDSDGACAEFALIVSRHIAGQGLGTHVLRRLIQWCRRKRLAAIYGTVLAENTPMLTICERLGFRVEHVPGEPGMMRVTLALRAEPAAAP